MNTVFVLSDSHGQSIFGENPLFEVRHLGPRTAFKLQDHHDLVMSNLHKLNNKDIIFVFGEIDCRKHIILKAKEQNKHLLDLINFTARTYVNYIKALKTLGFNISVFNVVPPAENPTGCQGTLEDRVLVTESLNFRLKKLCFESNIYFIDIYKHLIDREGYRLYNFVKDEAHLNEQVCDIFIKEGGINYGLKQN